MTCAVAQTADLLYFGPLRLSLMTKDTIGFWAHVISFSEKTGKEQTKFMLEFCGYPLVWSDVI